MTDRTPQQGADDLNVLLASAVNVVEGTIATAVNPGSSVTFRYTNPVSGETLTATGIALTQCPPSQVTALRTADGAWFVVGANFARQTREVVLTDRHARQVPETTGKIKYLYSVLNTDGSRDLWLGGWKPKPVQVMPLTGDESALRLKNSGGSNYLLDYFTYTPGSLTATTRHAGGVLYQAVLAGTGPIVGLGGSYFALLNENLGDTWSQLFRGDRLGALPGYLDGFAVQIAPVLPNLIPPPGGTNGQVRTFAINANGDRGIGGHLNFSDPRGYLAIFSAVNGIFYTTVTLTGTYLSSLFFDCFDANFSAVNRRTFEANVLTAPVFTQDLALYGFDGLQQSIKQTKVWGIPEVQRSTATLIGQPSYHP